MKKSLLTALNFSLGILGVQAIAGATAITLTSCTQNTSGYDKSITKQLNAQYNSELSVALGNKAYYQLTKDNQPKVVSVINKYLDQVNNIIAETENSFKLDESIWLRGFQYELQTKKKLVESNIRYIIVNSYDQMIMTNYSKSFQKTIANAAGQWMNGKNLVSANDRINQLTAIDTYITDIHNNLQEGLEVGTTWSGVLAKHTIGSMLQMLYDAELKQIATSSSGASISDLNNATLKGSLFTKNTNYDAWKTSSKDDENTKKSVDELVTKTQEDLDKLMNFLLGDYFKGIKYGRPTSISEGKSINFELVSTSPKEEDNGFSIKSGSDTKYIKGLGLDSKDLETKDIGIGFSGPTGQAIYKALLQKHSNVIDADPSQQYEFGASQVKGILNAMTQVANKIADLKGNGTTNKEWKETYMYDQDSSGNEFASVKKENVEIRNSSGVVNMPNFFQWLNSDQFFNGRDIRSDQFPTIDGTDNLRPN